METAGRTPGAGEVEDLSAGDLLALVRETKSVEEAAAARNLLLAAHWADMHPPESIGDEAVFIHGEHCEPIAGPGCPLVAEFCLAELGTVLGVSTIAARKLVGHALELRHRLPRLWDQVHAGRAPAWRARLVAEATIHATPTLTGETTGWIDAHVSPFAARLSQAQVDRLVEEAIRRQCPPEPVYPDDDPGRPDTRRVDIPLEDVSGNGTTWITGELDLPDAIDLDHVLSHHAATLKTLGNDAPLDARRAIALGDLARTQLTLDLTTQDGDTGPARPAESTADAGAGAEASGPAPAGGTVTGNPEAFTRTAREVVLHLHFNAGFTPGSGVEVDWLGRLERGQRLVLLEQVKAWCADSHTRVTVKPVIDLNTEITTDAYTPTDRLAEQVHLRDRTCVFPWCTRPARRCDLDHVEPFDHDAAADGTPQPGMTTTSNLGCLCRKHHRLKTHGRWKVRTIDSGVFEWTSPHGHRYLRDHTGTRPLDTDPDSEITDSGPPERP